RRRHTRFDCDWSSDVCSSDLAAPRDKVIRAVRLPSQPGRTSRSTGDAALYDGEESGAFRLSTSYAQDRTLIRRTGKTDPAEVGEIGRATCRERVRAVWVGG